jgi:hypothetical protein
MSATGREQGVPRQSIIVRQLAGFSDDIEYVRAGLQVGIPGAERHGTRRPPHGE